MKKFPVITSVVLLLLLTLPFSWPFAAIGLSWGQGVFESFGAAGRAQDDLDAGLPDAQLRLVKVEKVVRQVHPELGTPKYSWQEVRCGIEDNSAQFGIGWAQTCHLRGVWLFPAYGSAQDDCMRTDSKYMPGGLAFVVFSGGTRMLRSPNCPDVGRRPRGVYEGEWQNWVVAESRFIHGHRPVRLTGSQAWTVVVLESEISFTAIGCGLPGCDQPLDEPAMDLPELSRS